MIMMNRPRTHEKKYMKLTGATLVAIIVLTLFAAILPVPALSADVDVSVSATFSIADIVLSTLTTSGITISWTTDVPASSLLAYDAQAHESIYQYFTVVIDPDLTTSHSINLIGLTAGTIYHYRVQSSVDNGGTVTAVFSDDATFATLPDGGGGFGGGGFGGGGGGGVITDTNTDNINVSINGFISSGPLTLDSDGVVQHTVQLVSLDGTASLNILEGTSLLDTNSKPLSAITATKTAFLGISPPEGAVVLAYQFGPEIARFVPPLTLTIFYGEAALYSGGLEDSFYIVSREGTEWIPLASRVDPVTHTISTQLSHFSLYVVMGKTVAPVASSAPTTAATVVPTKNPVKTVPAPSRTTTTTPKLAAVLAPVDFSDSTIATPLLTPAPAPASKKPPTATYLLIMVGIFSGALIAAIAVFLKSRPKL
jgi:hypothetical protein